MSTVRHYVRGEDVATELVFIDVPDELRVTFRPYAEWLARYAPRWCARIIVTYESSDGAALSVLPDREYNCARVKLHAGWFTDDAAARMAATAHELVHVYAAQVRQWVDDLKAHEWTDAPNARTIREQQYRHADESFTEDMARLLVRHLPGVVASTTVE